MMSVRITKMGMHSAKFCINGSSTAPNSNLSASAKNPENAINKLSKMIRHILLMINFMSVGFLFFEFNICNSSKEHTVPLFNSLL